MKCTLGALALLATLASAERNLLPRGAELGCLAEPRPEFLTAAADMATKESSGEISNLLATIEVDVYFHIVASSTALSDGYITVR